MVTAEDIATRRAEIAASADLQRLLAHLSDRARPLLERMPHIPDEKALLSMDGGVCPKDGAQLAFDPWSPDAHRCPRCGETYSGERHDRHWARFQHLWLAERAAHLSAIAALGQDSAAAARARDILSAYAERYLRYPNRDNVLGPSRLFFSTYLESLWVLNYLSAAVLLRESGQLDDATSGAVSQVADEAANLIGDFDEWFSNRQTWNNAALVAVAVWFEDEELAQRAIESKTGLLAHLAQGFGRDGMWYEGENYHLFALRGLLTGAAWALQAGVDLFARPEAAARARAALRAPAITALPDFTYPARKDSRFGVSLTQPAYLELWEIGIARLKAADLLGWLKALYDSPPTTPELMESYLHDAPYAPRPTPHARSALSWRSLLAMLPELPADVAPWSPRSELLEAQGLAVLRTPRGGGYASLECGPWGGPHGHRDRLHLNVFADGVYWLRDFGTGSYLSRDLFWYRSTLAHNAPRLDGRSQPAGAATAEAFDQQGEWAWARGRYGDATRTIVAAPTYLIDVLDLASREEHLIEIPWHFAGGGEVETSGRWENGELEDEFVTTVERFVPSAPGRGPLVVAVAASERRLRAHMVSSGDLFRAEAPGKPGGGEKGPRERFYFLRVRGRGARLVTLLESIVAAPTVRAVRAKGDLIEVETVQGIDRHSIQPQGWSIERQSGSVRLGGRRQPEAPFQPVIQIDPPTKAHGTAFRLAEPPSLDGTLAGFDTGEPLVLDVEDQYRRSEDPYPGPEDFSAIAYVNWTDHALYVAVEVTKPGVCFRAADAPPLRLDNERDDIHSDGVQLHFQEGDEGEEFGFLIVPEGLQGGSVRVRAVEGTAARPDMVNGAWVRTDQGYRVTVAIAFSEGTRVHVGGRLGFDLIVNEMLPGRVRRSGQLVWSGGNGWVWLRGDRHSPERFGVLDLVG